MVNLVDLDIDQINFDKLDGLIPVCVQDFQSMQLLILGFMNRQALEKTLTVKKVTFYSRTKKKLWTKGESSGNTLIPKEYILDCDKDSLLIYAQALGPTCHKGNTSCFESDTLPPLYWFWQLFQIIEERKKSPQKGSYTNRLFDSPLERMAQKVGEEGVEVAISSVSSRKNNQDTVEETVDLLYHLFVLIQAKDITLEDISSVIKSRNES